MAQGMERNFAVLLRFLNSATDPSIHTFKDRIRLQKLTYLAREIGFDAGFSFSWYLHGPYSPSLTNFLFDADKVGILNNPPKVEFVEEKVLEGVIHKLKTLVGSDFNDSKTLELIASVWYVLPRGTLTESRRDTIVRMLGQMKPDFAPGEYKDAVERVYSFRQKELRD